MKKIIAFLTLLCLLSAPALAESAIDWAEVEPTLAEEGLEGGFVVVGETGLKVWLPAGTFVEVELSEEQVAAGDVALLSTEDGSAGLTITCVDIGMNAAGYADYLRENGYADVEVLTLNGLTAVSYASPDEDFTAVGAFVTGTAVAEFIFTPASDKDFAALSAIIAASIQSAE